ncbi:MAG: hypothetical protein FD123_1707 [Bacteroidetes bacterium]|nr:MAG: hypothetical protein FD123_1707 [Bacteroidota bacterium]
MAEPDFEALRKKLEESGSWPMVYMFKFIVPSDNQKIALVESLFGDDSQVSLRSSSNDKYTSITAREVMLSPEMVIAVYRKAASIEGVIAL